ncbi:hypothetical protein L5515_015428 [Caenorhabditis briggsae]|uniref:DUF7154 domain-containing protein n=1 Tax=Caenorhabditis briggsae TaxID=6238 RepID=A0AAE9EHB4_CAEBR|nr:hypothetical protein L5515_015428 [Caenorhabditis briggsae]
MDIEFHRNVSDVLSTVQKNLPDPSVGFQNSSLGSNVYNALEKFFSNTQAPVCGSIILVLSKRYPNDANISGFVAKIRSHHSILHVMTSASPSGGSQPKSMYSVASKTNGMGAFETDYYFPGIISSFPLYDYRYPVYAATVQVSGSGTKTLPDFHSPVSDIYWIAITYQDHLPINSFQNLTLRWTSPEDSESWSVNLQFDVAEMDGGNFEGSYSDFSAVNYSMTLAYNYSGQDVEALQIRIYSQT